jgi:uncharacterized phage protein (TIGR01671 family)
MREIKFRGKQIGGEWLYGNLIILPNKTLITQPTGDGTYRDYGVFEDSVGQFTGKTDKNGQEIYEDDICRVVIHDSWSKKPISTSNCLVVFKDFKIGVIHGHRGEVIHFDGFCNTTFEVIGNLWDNPELLEVTPDAQNS